VSTRGRKREKELKEAAEEPGKKIHREDMLRGRRYYCLLDFRGVE